MHVITVTKIEMGSISAVGLFEDQYKVYSNLWDKLPIIIFAIQCTLSHNFACFFCFCFVFTFEKKDSASLAKWRFRVKKNKNTLKIAALC